MCFDFSFRDLAQTRLNLKKAHLRYIHSSFFNHQNYIKFICCSQVFYYFLVLQILVSLVTTLELLFCGKLALKADVLGRESFFFCLLISLKVSYTFRTQSSPQAAHYLFISLWMLLHILICTISTSSN